MIARISRSLHDRLLALAAAEPDREICGLLLGARGERIVTVLPTANCALDPARTFEIDPATLIAALKAERRGGPQVLGHYHSHPSGTPTPSPRDAAMALDPGRLWLIVGEGRVAAWQSVPGGSVAGAFDPVTLLVEPDGCETGHGPPQGTPPNS